MINRKRNQQFFSADPQPLCLATDSPELFFEQLTPTKKRIFNAILEFTNWYQELFPTQSTIAEMAGCSREEVCRALQEFEELGLMVSDYRHMTSKRYKVSSWFFLPGIRFALSKIFKALSWLPIVVLTQLILISYNEIKTNPNSYVNTNYILSHTVRRESARSRATSVCQFIHDLEKASAIGADIMNGDNPIPQSIRTLKYLNLTKWGQIALTVFPDAAINDTSMRYNAAQGIKDPFKWFYKLCDEYCQREGIEKNWTRYNVLVEYFKMPHDARMTLSEKPEPVVIPNLPTFKPKTDYIKPTSAPQTKKFPPISHQQTPEKTPANVKGYPYRKNPGEKAPRPMREIEAEMAKLHEKIKQVKIQATCPKIISQEDELSMLNRIFETLGFEYSRAYDLYGVPEHVNEPTPKETEPELFHLDGIPHVFNSSGEFVERDLAKNPEEVIVAIDTSDEDTYEEILDPEDDAWESGRM